MTIKNKDHYNLSLHNLIPGDIAPYDTKVYETVGSYINEHLWIHMDKDWVKKVVFVLDDPLQEYGNDTKMIQQVLKSFLPAVKKALKIDKAHLLKDRIKTPIRREGLIDRLIQQRFNLYLKIRNTSGLLTKVLQEGPKKEYLDMTKPHTKELAVDNVPQTQKTIIANILTFMILKEELKHTKRSPNTIIHHLD